MLIISYDFSSNSRRAKFSKFLRQYGDKVQFSVYKIKNSKRILNIILNEIEHKYKNTFENTDSIYIFSTCEACTKKIVKYGSASHEDEEVVYFC